ncbi:GH3 family domain-containing protein, partial [Thiolapillus sp.]|uniref:GH3 family domain-containing protein n=4 Tax=Thiolapillus sp. TaxID=2017437 RepID=UPI003AF98720
MQAWDAIRKAVEGEREKFIQSTRMTAQVQEQVLQGILHRHRGSRFGREHDFAFIGDSRQYAHQLPLTEYRQTRPWIKAMLKGDRQALIADWSHFETTGGSEGGAKIIPYGASGMRGFQKALYPWLDDLLQQRPAISKGSAYWSISPVLRSDRTAESVPLGLKNDALYFGSELAGNISRTLAVPATAGEFSELLPWQTYTLKHLLQAQDLRMISVWSPTFLLQLMKALGKCGRRLTDSLPSLIRQRLRDALKTGTLDTTVLWPELDTLSCWTQGPAQVFVPALRQLFPQAHIQGKGLLATEGVVSVPVEGAQDPVLAVNSGYFEFVDNAGKVLQAAEVQPGERYRIILTNDLGMYRYDLGDEVEITGWYEKAPMLRFRGRISTSDLVGEKLEEVFVARVLESVDGFSLLCAVSESQPGYVLLSETSKSDAARIEKGLFRNPQYAYARKMGQLAPLAIRQVAGLDELYSRWR